MKKGEIEIKGGFLFSFLDLDNEVFIDIKQIKNFFDRIGIIPMRII